MMNIYYNDGVNPSECVHTCSTLIEAKNWVNKQLKGYTLVDNSHKCTEDVLASSRTALSQVYDGEPVTLNKDGEPTFASPICESNYFYTEKHESRN